MKKSKFLVPVACLGLLMTALTGCGGNTASSKPSGTSKNPTTSSTTPTTSSTTPAPSSDVQPSSQVTPVEDELYYSLPMGAEGKWEKGHEYKWTFDVKESHAKMTFAFGAQMSSSSHSDRSLYTDHNGASSSDPFESNEANDGTCRVALKVNGEVQEVFHTTYGDAGLTSTEINYFKIAEFAVKKGNVEVSMTTHASVGYRLILGGEARLYYPKNETPVPEAETQKVTFMNGDVKVSETDVEVGETPVDPAQTAIPTKAPDANGAYIFRGWDKAIEAVVKGSDVVYNAVYEAVPFVVQKVSVEAKGTDLVLSASGEMKVQETAELTAAFNTKHNDNLDHHGWDVADYVATATFTEGKFEMSAKLNDEANAKMVEFRDNALILSVKIGADQLELKNEWKYDANATHDVNGTAVAGTWLNRPNVVLTGTEDVTVGDLSARLEAGNVDTWFCIYLLTHNESVKSLAAKEVSMKEIEGKVYYVIRGEAIGYTADDLAAARVDYQFNDNASKGGKGWGFIPEVTPEEIAAAEADPNRGGVGAGDWAGQALAEGHAPDFKVVENDGFEIRFDITDLAETARASAGAAVLTVHYSLLESQRGLQRPSVSFPVASDYAPVIINDYRYAIYQSLEQTWGIASIMISKPAEDTFIEGAHIDADDDGVYYVVDGIAGALTKEELEGGKMLYQHNDNQDHAGWGIPVENLAPAKVELSNGVFHQYFRVDDQEGLKPTEDNASYVFTTKLDLTATSGQIEMKLSQTSKATIVRDGYEYATFVSGDTWNIVDLKVTKLAAN